MTQSLEADAHVSGATAPGRLHIQLAELLRRLGQTAQDAVAPAQQGEAVNAPIIEAKTDVQPREKAEAVTLILPCRRQVAETEICRRRPFTPIGQNAREQEAGHQGLAAGLAIKNPPKKPKKTT